MMLTFFKKETAYNTPVPSFAATNCCSMLDFEDASAHEEWNDMVIDNTDLVSGAEFSTHQELVRQSMQVTYTEPRLKPNTMAGLLGLTMGVPAAATQDGVLIAYRHRFEPSSSVGLPSIGMQTVRDQGSGTQYRYDGVKADSFILSNQGAFFQGAAQLIGSGSRTLAADAFPPAIDEAWMRWGDAKIYIKDTAGVPITTTLPTPSQSAPNLGGSEVNVSTRVLSWTLTWNNNMPADFGYRPSTGMVRQNTHPTRRAATLAFQLETETTTEATELAYYLTQKQLAIELNINTGVLVAATGVFFGGAIVIIPRIQLRQIRRNQTNQLENLEFMGQIMSDGTNPAMISWIYNKIPTYLA